MNIGNTIKSIRKKRGLSQKQFAEMLEIRNTYLSEIENGRKKRLCFSLYCFIVVSMLNKTCCEKPTLYIHCQRRPKRLLQRTLFLSPVSVCLSVCLCVCVSVFVTFSVVNQVVLIIKRTVYHSFQLCRQFLSLILL